MELPESELELDNLTEYNTAHNRRVTMLGKLFTQTANAHITMDTILWFMYVFTKPKKRSAVILD